MNTLCEELGYAVGEKFRVTDEDNEVDLSVGSIVRLAVDDNTNQPGFKLIVGRFKDKEAERIFRGKTIYLYLHEVEKIYEEESDEEADERTPCQKKGYKIGDTFEIINDIDTIWKKGSIVELIEDDGTTLPYFKGTVVGQNYSFIALQDVKKLGDFY